MSVKSLATPKTLFAFGLNHKTAPVDVREKLYLDEAEVPEFLVEVKKTLPECLVLSTCNRTEFYGVSDSPEIDLEHYKDLLVDFKNARGLVEDGHFFSLISCAACQQLFNVATSIDSRIIGDSQILKQLRDSYSLAQKNGSAGKILNQLLQRAFKIGKKTYTETSIHDGAVSVSLAAVETAVEVFGSLENRTAMVIGAGDTARLAAEALVNKRVGKLLVSNRTRTTAEQLLGSLDHEFSFESAIVDFAEFKGRLSEADIIITSTGSPEPILYKDDFVGLERKILAIDIAVPRDIDTSVGENLNVILRNIDDLNSIVVENHERRMGDLPKVKKMVMREMVDFLTWYYSLSLMPEYQKTGTKPSVEQRNEVLRIKEFLDRNASEIHKVATQSSGNFREDLEMHISLVRTLQLKRAEAFGLPL